MTAQAHRLGRRLHLNHGPIDLIIEAFGAPAEIAAAYRQATSAFPDVLPTLVQELKLLRTPLSLRHSRESGNPGFSGTMPAGACPRAGGGGHDDEKSAQNFFPSPPIPMGGEARGRSANAPVERSPSERVRGAATHEPAEQDPHPPTASPKSFFAPAGASRRRSAGAPPSPAVRARGFEASEPQKNCPSPPILMGGEGRVRGAVATRMISACTPFAADFITPMAAVAGAVADHMLEQMLAGRTLDRAYVNDGGDIAFYLAPGQTLTCGVVADLAAPAIDGTIVLTSDMPVRGIATSGRATKGQGGRSFSLGIADAVTVLARDAAAADAAATIIANAVDLPGHPAVRRGPASDIDPDSDLGERLVTLDVGPLSDAEIRTALQGGVELAQALRRSGLIHGAVLVLKRRFATVGAGVPRLAAA